MMSSATILVVDDEPVLLQTVRVYLEQAGFTVQTTADGGAVLALARALHPDLIILDIMLPGMDGLDILTRLRRESSVYVLMLTARAEESDKVVGLTLGADDYLTKPFSPGELVARVKAILRRGRDARGEEPPLIFDRLRIDPEARRIWKGDAPVELTPTEFDLLYALARHPGRVLSREQLIEQVWGYDFYGDERVVDVHLGRLRKKIEDDDGDHPLIATVRGVGYRFEGEPG